MGFSKMQSRGIKALSLALLGSTFIAPAVAAQDSEQVMSVYERYRPDLSAPGIRTGGFLFYPEVKAEGKFDSNIFAVHTKETDDFIAIVKPSFNLVSDWNNNYFALKAGADIGRYSDNSTEDYEDFNIGASGRIDMSRGTNIFTELTYNDLHEDRGSPDTDGTQEIATPYTVLKAVVGFKRDEGILSFTVDGSYEKSDYDDVGRIGGGTLENDDRDRETYRGSVRLGYDLNDVYEAFAKFTTVEVVYDPTKREIGGPLRDSDGWDVVGGAAFDVSGKTMGEFFVGYVKRDWDNASFTDVGEFKFGAALLWTADLTSVRVGVNRDVTETTTAALNSEDNFVPAAGILATSYTVRMEHELRRNLLLNADASYSKMDYIGTLRTDDVYDLGVGMKYLLNRNFSLNADLKYGERASNADNSDYDRTSVIVSLSAHW